MTVTAPAESQDQKQSALRAYLFEKKWGDGKPPTLYLDCTAHNWQEVKRTLDQNGVEVYPYNPLPRHTTFRIKEPFWDKVRTLGFTEFTSEEKRVANLHLLDGRAPGVRSH